MRFKFKNRKKLKKEKTVDKETTEEEYLKWKNEMENEKRHEKMRKNKRFAIRVHYIRGYFSGVFDK